MIIEEKTEIERLKDRIEKLEEYIEYIRLKYEGANAVFNKYLSKDYNYYVEYAYDGNKEKIIMTIEDDIFLTIVKETTEFIILGGTKTFNLSGDIIDEITSANELDIFYVIDKKQKLCLSEKDLKERVKRDKYKTQLDRDKKMKRLLKTTQAHFKNKINKLKRIKKGEQNYAKIYSNR